MIKPALGTAGALLFGKLPAHGDFVGRGIDPHDRDALDRWLAASLAEARARLGDAFDDLYEEAPAWRFAWADPAGWSAGAMALSVDSVGRRYPILIALTGLAGDQVEAAAAAAENLIYDALEGGWDADRLHEAAARTTPEPMTTWEGGEGWWTLGGARFNESYLVGSRPTGLLTTLLTPAAPEPAAAVAVQAEADRGGERDDA